MKRTLSLLLALVLTFSLAACGETSQHTETTAPQKSPVPAENLSSGPVAARNVDELLAAIQPGAKIYLGPGVYDLSTASDYGSSSSPYYTWNSLGLGEYELQLQDLENVVIFGSGQGQTSLITQPRWANVLNLMNCTDIALEDMTLGHTEMTEACEGGVIRIENCEEIGMKRLGLYGCGTLGLLAFKSQDIDMRSCEIYDCSIGGLQITRCEDVSVKDSSFHDLGKDVPIMHVFCISDSQNVLIESCAIFDNYVDNLIFGGGDVTLRHNQITSNQISRAAFCLTEAGVVLDDNVFDQNQLRNWYTLDSIFPAVDAQGNEVQFETPAAKPAAVTPGEAAPVSEGEQKEVRVDNVDDFLGAIAPDTCVILETELLDLSKSQSYQNALKEFANAEPFEAATYAEEYHPYCYWLYSYDGPALFISGVKNLTIKAEGKDRKASTISASPRYADVLAFENCEDITLSGFTAGHTIEPGQCTGGVFLLQNCEDILIDNCGMYGCGTEGVNGISSRNIQIVNSEIYECSYTGIELSQCENVAISGTLIRDIRNDREENPSHFLFRDSKNVTLDGEPLDGNYRGR